MQSVDRRTLLGSAAAAGMSMSVAAARAQAAFPQTTRR